MSKNDEQGQGLPLPAPRSPRALDERITAYARGRAAQKTGWYRPRWAAGLATAGVAGIAVLLSLQAPEWSPENTLSAPPPQREAAADSDSAQSVAHAGAAPREARQAALEEVVLTARKRKPRTQAADEPGLSDRAAHKAAPQDQDDYYAREAAPALGAMQDAGAAASALRQGAVGRSRELIAACLALLEQDDAAGAARCYQALRDTCPDCELPETLAEAREVLRAGEAGDD